MIDDAGEEEGGEPDNRPAWQKRIDDADGVKRTANGTPIRKDGPIGSNDGGGAPQVEGDSRPQFDKPPPTPKGDFESGESMGIQAKVTVTEELMSLVDFCETNKLIVDAAPQATGAAALAAAAMPGEKKYLVTLDGKVALKARSALYRQYLIECFDANDQVQAPHPPRPPLHAAPPLSILHPLSTMNPFPLHLLLASLGGGCGEVMVVGVRRKSRSCS